jgi:hypothetical protein
LGGHPLEAKVVVRRRQGGRPPERRRPTGHSGPKCGEKGMKLERCFSGPRQTSELGCEPVRHWYYVIISCLCFDSFEIPFAKRKHSLIIFSCMRHVLFLIIFVIDIFSDLPLARSDLVAAVGFGPTPPKRLSCDHSWDDHPQSVITYSKLTIDCIYLLKIPSTNFQLWNPVWTGAASHSGQGDLRFPNE